MIRFVDLGKQLGIDDEWPREFSFFNTVSCNYVTLGHHQTWDCWEDFEECHQAYMDHWMYPLERFKSLCPDWVFKNNEEKQQCTQQHALEKA